MARFYNLTEWKQKKFFKGPSPQPLRLSKPLCMYVCIIIIHIIYEWHSEVRGCLCVGGGGGKGGDSLQLKI